MFDNYWKNNYTFEDRYELTGINDFIFEYARESGKKKFVIVDVGCSKGIAMKNTSNYLKEKGFEPFTIGIDYSNKVAEEATKHFNRFINVDILSINNGLEKADIVICSKAAIFVPGPIRYKIFKKCIEFLKNDSILITDLGRFEKPKLFADLKLIQYEFPTPSCFKNGIRGFSKEYRRRLNVKFKKKMRKMNKVQALNYAEEILSGWNKLSWLEKLDWKFQIFFLKYQKNFWLALIIISGLFTTFH